MNTTIDGLLNRRVMLEQPAEGYRVAVDTVLLAAAVPAQAGEHLLDLGCGAGGAMLCLAARVPGIAITGIEIQDELAELCRRNIARNKFQMSDIRCQMSDIRHLSSDICPLSSDFDHALMNPPYHDEARHDVSAHAGKRVANAAKEGDLALWIMAAARALKSGGTLTLIHRADRLEEILALAAAHFGETEILPIAPKVGAAPKRAIVRMRKGKQASVRQCKNFILHKPEGGYTDEAEAVLRHAKKLDFIE